LDINRDGSITAYELQQALKRTQTNSDFNMRTVELLIATYDRNGDKEISFEEFSDLFNNLNEEYANFLMMDEDSSGEIDLQEFTQAMSRKGYEFTESFYKMILDNVRKHTSAHGLKFDNYIRIAARFDFLVRSYRSTPYFHKQSLEQYLKKTFFQDFW
jgi:Ca2+-binding EF-hand superfamily protein